MKKLILNKETVRNLSATEMKNVAGGNDSVDCTVTCVGCYQTLDCPLPSHPGKCVSWAPGKICETGTAIFCC